MENQKTMFNRKEVSQQISTNFLYKRKLLDVYPNIDNIPLEISTKCLKTGVNTSEDVVFSVNSSRKELFNDERNGERNCKVTNTISIKSTPSQLKSKSTHMSNSCSESNITVNMSPLESDERFISEKDWKPETPQSNAKTNTENDLLFGLCGAIKRNLDFYAELCVENEKKERIDMGCEKESVEKYYQEINSKLASLLFN